MNQRDPVVGDEIVMRFLKMPEDGKSPLDWLDYDGYWGGVDADGKFVVFLRGMKGPELACVKMSRHIACGAQIYPKESVPPKGQREGAYELVRILKPPMPSQAQLSAFSAET